MSSRTALVTGAHRGIGLEVCPQVAQQGLKVVLTGRLEVAMADAADELRIAGGDVRGEALDVASEDSVTACAARLFARGEHVDVLVNNAGVYPQGDLLTASSDALREAMAINFFGALWTARPGCRGCSSAATAAS
jgi:NAD(P)-dependent dehydrogenase (short-subunit alcohol dehydrogenase family)